MWSLGHIIGGGRIEGIQNYYSDIPLGLAPGYNLPLFGSNRVSVADYEGWRATPKRTRRTRPLRGFQRTSSRLQGTSASPELPCSVVTATQTSRYKVLHKLASGYDSNETRD